VQNSEGSHSNAMIVKGMPRPSICLIGACVAFVLTFLFVTGYLFWFRNKERDHNVQVQHYDLKDRVEKANKLLRVEISEVETLAKSLALSDELASYISDKSNENWIKANLTPLLSQKGRYRKVDSILIYTGKDIELSHQLLDGFDKPEIIAKNPMIIASLTGEVKSSFVISRGAIYAVSAAPITQIYDQSNVKGVILIGRKIDGSILNWYGDLVGGDFVLVTPSQVEYPSNRKYTFTPPLFADSLKAVKIDSMLQFGEALTRPISIVSQANEAIAVLWIVTPFNQNIALSALSINSSKKLLFIAFGTASLVGVFVYLFLYLLVRRPIRRALYRMASDHLSIHDGEFNTFIEDILSVKKAIRRLQNAVSQSKDVRKTILHSISEGFQLLNAKGGTLEVNASMCSLVGVNRDRFLKESNPFFYLNEEGRDIALEFLELVGKGEVNLRRGFESELSWSDGEHKLVKIRLCSVEDEASSESHVCVFVDSQDSRSDMQFNIHELGKMTMLVKFAGSIAHNMNNILTGILSATSLMERGKISPETQSQLLVSMREAVTKGTSLCTELLHMSKVRQARNTRRLVDICPLIHDVVRMASGLQEAKNHDIKVFTPPEPLLALCDDSGFHHVLLNLILNSIDAMSDTGIVEVRAELERGPTDPVIKIRVVDNGVGMSPDIKKMIFNPFFTTKKGRTRKKTFGGTGLGLASALETIQSWGGSIECNSELGSGSTFEITLQTASLVSTIEEPPVSDQNDSKN